MIGDPSTDYMDPDSEAEVPVSVLLAFVKAKNFRCDVCNSQVWFTTSGPGGDYAVSTASKPALFSDSGYDISSYLLICLECGNTKFFNKVVVKYALKEMRENLSEAAGQSDE